MNDEGSDANDEVVEQSERHVAPEHLVARHLVAFMKDSQVEVDVVAAVDRRRSQRRVMVEVKAYVTLRNVCCVPSAPTGDASLATCVAETTTYIVDIAVWRLFRTTLHPALWCAMRNLVSSRFRGFKTPLARAPRGEFGVREK
jgi:hypothetical protein